MIELVGFDADDTLWRSQDYFDAAELEFETILARRIDLADGSLRQRLLEAEQRNLALFGYGAKGMTLSMLETATTLAGDALTSADVAAILALGKRVLAHPVELLPGVRAAVAAVAAIHRVVLITKGDLFHQERKLRASGLADLFPRIEVVSEKDAATYQRVLAEFALEPARFVMVGNSLRSDIEPVLALGGAGVYMPYRSTWAHEAGDGSAARHPRCIEVADAAGIPAAIDGLARRAA